MSEYNNFLNYFNAKKMAEKAEAAQHSNKNISEPGDGDDTADTIISSDKRFIKEPDGEEQIIIERSVAGGDITSLFPDKNEDVEREKDGEEETGDKPRFIKTPDSSFVSVKTAQGSSDALTQVEKYTDRLSPKPPEKKQRTGYTGKINTYSANHSADGAAPKFISVSEEELEKTAAKPLSAKPKPKAQTKIIPQVIEKSDDKTVLSGIIVEKLPDSDIKHVPDDTPTKHISAEKGSLLRELAKTSEDEARQNPDQLMLDGFDELLSESENESSDITDELKDELVKVRKKRINDFHFWDKEKGSQGEIEDATFTIAREKHSLPKRLEKFAEKFQHLDSSFIPMKGEEYSDLGSRRKVFSTLIDLRAKTLIKVFATGLIGIILFIINIAASVTAAANNGFFTLFNGNAVVYAAVNAVLLLAACALTAGDLKRGLFSILKLRPKTDAAFLFMMLCCLAENIAVFFTQQKIESDFHMLSSTAVLLCVPLLLSRVFYYDSVRHCFKAVAVKSDKAYLRKVSNEKLVSSILADGNPDNRNVVYSGKTRFISSFLKRSTDCAFGGQISSRVILFNMCLSVLTGLLTAVLKDNFLLGLSAGALCAALSFPVGCIFFTGFMLANENKALSIKSSFIQSYSDARDFAGVDNIVISAQDVFSMRVTETVCASGVSNKQAHFCAAALTNKAGGILKTAFESTASELESSLPEVEDLIYEDRLGYSAWISGCRVLLGSNAFLVNHNVAMPDEKGVMGFIDEGNLPLYLAIEGHFTAMFSIKYSCNGEPVKRLKALVDSGTNLLLTANDPNITDFFAETLMELPSDSVRVINKNAAEKIFEQKKTVTDSEDTGVVFTDSFEALSRTAFSALKLDRIKKLTKIICEVSSCLGAALALILALTGSVNAISCWLPLIVQGLWIFLCFALPVFFTGSSAIPFSRSTVRPMARREAYTPENYAPQTSGEEIHGQDGFSGDGELQEEAKTPGESEEESEADIDEEKQKPLNSDDYLSFNTEFLSEEEKSRLEKETQGDYSFSLKGSLSDSQAASYEQPDDNISERPYEQEPEEGSFARTKKKKGGFFHSLLQKTADSFKRDERDDNDEYSDRIKKPIPAENGEKKEKPSILSFATEDPAPPKYDLSKEDDYLKEKFTPPQGEQPETLYNDAFFSRFEDDKIFAGLEEQKNNRPDF